MQNDERCCGTGTCIIDTDGRCWCGQQWDGTKMCHPQAINTPVTSPTETAPSASPSTPRAPHE